MPASNGGAGRLDPVMVEALKQLRSFTYRRRQLRSTMPFLAGLARVPATERHQLERLVGLRYQHPVRENPGRGVGRAVRAVRARLIDALDVIRAVTHVRIEDRERSLNDPGARSGAIHTFKHLKHYGYTWNAEAVHEWAISNGFTAQDARHLAELADGVQAGTRYHTQPDPFGQHAITYWRQDAERQP